MRLVKSRSIGSPPYSPGGRLIECTTSRVISVPAGRSSWLGESTMRSGFAVVFDAKALHPVPELAERDAQELRRRSAVEAGLAKRLEDRLALDVVEVIGQRPGLRFAFRFGSCARGRAEAQVLGSHLAAARECERSLQDVFELADVAREVVAPKLFQRLGGQACRRRAGLGGEPLEDRGRDDSDVIAAVAQRRHGELDDVDAIEEILPEAPRS